MRPCEVWCEIVGEIAVCATFVSEGVGGVIDVVEVPRGCPRRCGGHDGEPWRKKH